MSSSSIETAQLIRSEIIQGSSYIADAQTIINHGNKPTINEDTFASLANAIEPASGGEGIENNNEAELENEQNIETKKLIESLSTLSTINYREK